MATGVLKSVIWLAVVVIVVATPGCHCEYYSGGVGRNCRYDSAETISRDVLTVVGQFDEVTLEADAQRFAARFSLSDEQGLLVARATRDFSMLENRTEQDLADFSLRLYGVSPMEVAAAVEQNYLGNREQMNVLVDRAAVHFGTDRETMKDVIRELHGAALREAGLDL